MGYKRIALKGVGWISAFRVFSRIVAFLKIAIIARILVPSEFGLFGIATLLLTFLEVLTETGINVVLIQTKNNIEKYINSAWVISVGRGILLSLLIFLSAPFITKFFNTPNALGIVMAISIVPLVRGFINPAEVFFQKELKFKYEFLFRSSIFVVDSVVSIIIVVLTQSMYGLVIGLLAGVIFELILSFIVVKPIPKFVIDKGYFSSIFHKGKWVTAYGIFNYLGENGDNIAVGKIMGASSLGIYQMAYKISILPLSEISDVINRVVFPIYTRIEEDIPRLKQAFIKIMLLIFFSTLFIAAIIYFYPKEIILLILGNKWISAIYVLQVLSIYGFIRANTGAVFSLFFAVKKQNYVTAISFFRFIVLILSIYPMVIAFGLIGAGYSALFSAIAEVPVIAYFAIKVLGKK